MSGTALFHPDFYAAQQLVFAACGFALTDLTADAESQDYGACSFRLNGKRILFRTAKITPTKTGQFVTLWKRNAHGITQPFAATDELDVVVICARSGDQFGQFIFPKSVLIAQGVFASENKPGKRGIRVYPPWDKATSKQAEQTQGWQCAFFVATQNKLPQHLEVAKRLFGL